MAYYLLPGTSDPNFRLHVSEDPLAVERALKFAYQQQQLVEVKVDHSGSVEPMRVQVNPSVLPWWSVASIPDPDES